MDIANRLLLRRFGADRWAEVDRGRPGVMSGGSAQPDVNLSAVLTMFGARRRERLSSTGMGRPPWVPTDPSERK